MGQYHVVVNRDKRQYLNPHRFGDGKKLLEFGASGHGAMLGLAVLLARDTGRGGGDLRADREEHPIVGSWAGDRIEIAGDYGDPVVDDERNLYEIAHGAYREVSAEVIAAIVASEGPEHPLAAVGSVFR